MTNETTIFNFSTYRQYFTISFISTLLSVLNLWKITKYAYILLFQHQWVHIYS